jgi:hypothetical protein
MRGAHRGERLDFGKVLEEEPASDYRRATSELKPGERKRQQREFLSAIKAVNKPQGNTHFITPSYDAEFWRAVETLDRESD